MNFKINIFSVENVFCENFILIGLFHLVCGMNPIGDLCLEKCANPSALTKQEFTVAHSESACANIIEQVLLKEIGELVNLTSQFHSGKCLDL